ncbi:MAG TPA: DUF1206 domain-containing protein [Solirubrobacteraceae bacterium]|jgi:hypothetical protein|nr:DUF1206 domain-containing protein [Solirubrobacteraceae bacterium]
MATSPLPSPVRRVQRGGEAATRRPEFAWLARGGLIARGVVYGVVGVLALKLALGSAGRATNQQGALKTVAHEPFGKALLIALTVGLAGYALWRLVRAAIGHGTQDRDSDFERVAGVASGLAYAGLCLTAVEILAGAGGGGGSGNPKKAAGGVLAWTGGTVIVAAAGAILIGVALYQGYKGISRRFLAQSNTAQMSPAVKRGFLALGVFGHLARMVVFGLIGFGLLKAAIDYNAHNAIGLDGALNKLAHNSYGPFLLGLVAAGLVGFALYSIADARYRKV